MPLLTVINMFRRNEDRFNGAPPVPYNITVTEGSVQIVAVREFVKYVVYNETTTEFLDWVKNTNVPDETFFSSLNHNPHLQVPGSYLGMLCTNAVRIVMFRRTLLYVMLQKLLILNCQIF